MPSSTVCTEFIKRARDSASTMRIRSSGLSSTSSIEMDSWCAMNVAREELSGRRKLCGGEPELFNRVHRGAEALEVDRLRDVAIGVEVVGLCDVILGDGRRQ